MDSHNFRFNFSPSPSPIQKVRIGPNSDGGYVVSQEVSSNCKLLISFGIGDDERFEKAFSKEFGSKIVMVDPGYPENQSETNVWRLTGKAIPESLTPEEGQLNPGHRLSQVTTLTSDNFNIDREAKTRSGLTGLTLKLDIEWDEWDLLESLSDEQLHDIDQLIVEFHMLPVEMQKKMSPYFSGFFTDVYGKFNRSLWEKYTKVLSRLDQFFQIIHIHPNNSIGVHHFFPQKLPYLLEVTWVRRDAQFVYKSNNGFEAPDPQLDFPNKSDRADVNAWDWEIK
jgi:hypothetical protein